VGEEQRDGREDETRGTTQEARGASVGGGRERKRENRGRGGMGVQVPLLSHFRYPPTFLSLVLPSFHPSVDPTPPFSSVCAVWRAGSSTSGKVESKTAPTAATGGRLRERRRRAEC
jgi:hypothetical protein